MCVSLWLVDFRSMKAVNVNHLLIILSTGSLGGVTLCRGTAFMSAPGLRNSIEETITYFLVLLVLDDFFFWDLVDCQASA